MHAKLRGLYVIIDPAVAGDRDPVWIASEAIAGGATVLQWRDKTREKGLQLPDVQKIAELCRAKVIPLIINDDIDLALAIDSGAVHVGQKDLPVAVVRRIIPGDWIIGASTNNIIEAQQAVADGATYVSVGNLFGTTSKEITRPATLDTLRAVKDAVDVPVSAIGGINESNIDSVIEAGADMACVISAVVAADNPREAAQRLASHFKGAS